jgi:coenzyme F420-reducing hydrogenase beta subunit
VAVNIESIDRSDCFGCFACLDTCPTRAITSVEDEEGFLVPLINKDGCTQCAKCWDICPVNNLGSKNYSEPIVYGAWHKDSDVVKRSTSGGVFTALASNVLDDGGSVYGAKFSPGWNLRHSRAANLEELAPMRGSKYVQSSCEGIYLNIEKDLQRGQKVLFVGTPCQVAAVQRYMCEVPEIDNLLCVDIICHGVNSPGVFKKYVQHLESVENDNLVSFNFRQKNCGWIAPQVEATFKRKKLVRVFNMDPFISGFRKNLYLRESCYSCPFAKIPRIGDITIGDFWGVPDDMYSNEGVSVVLLNNEQGKAFLDRAGEELNLQPSSFPVAKAKNPQLYMSNQRTEKVVRMREELFALLKEGRTKYLFNVFIYGRPFPRLRKWRYYFTFQKSKWLAKKKIENTSHKWVE